MAQLSKEHQLGGMGILSYLQDLFTISKKDSFSREEILMFLEDVGHDEELFEPGLMESFKDLPSGS